MSRVQFVLSSNVLNLAAGAGWMLSCLRHRPGRSNILGQIPTISALPGSSLLYWLPQLCHIISHPWQGHFVNFWPLRCQQRFAEVFARCCRRQGFPSIHGWRRHVGVMCWAMKSGRQNPKARRPNAEALWHSVPLGEGIGWDSCLQTSHLPTSCITLCAMPHLWESDVSKCLWGSVGRLLSIITHEFYSLGKHLLPGAIHTGGAFRAKLLEVWASNVRFLRISGDAWKISYSWSWFLYATGFKYTETLKSAAFQWSMHLVGLATMLLTFQNHSMRTMDKDGADGHSQTPTASPAHPADMTDVRRMYR